MLSCFHRFSYDISICIFLMISEFCADRNGDFPTSASLTGVTLAAHTGKCRGTGPSWAHLTCRTLRNTEVTTFLILPCVTMMLQSKKRKTKVEKTWRRRNLSSTVATAWSSRTWITGRLCRPGGSWRWTWCGATTGLHIVQGSIRLQYSCSEERNIHYMFYCFFHRYTILDS